MRDAVEKLIGDAVAIDLLTGGAAAGNFIVDESANSLIIC